MRALLGFMVMAGSLCGIPIAWGHGLSDGSSLVMMLIGMFAAAWLIGTADVSSEPHRRGGREEYRR